jgi:hypothetical protein
MFYLYMQISEILIHIIFCNSTELTVMNGRRISVYDIVLS